MNKIKSLIEKNEILTMLTPLFKGMNVYLVGGYLRDCLLNRESCDLDFVTEKGFSG